MRIPDEKHTSLHLAESRDAETRFRNLAASGRPARGLALLDQLDATAKA